MKDPKDIAGPIVIASVVASDILESLDSCLKEFGNEKARELHISGKIRVEDGVMAVESVVYPENTDLTDDMIACRLRASDVRGPKVSKLLYYPRESFLYDFTGKLIPKVNGKLWLRETQFSKEFSR